MHLSTFHNAHTLKFLHASQKKKKNIWSDLIVVVLLGCGENLTVEQ